MTKNLLRAKHIGLPSYYHTHFFFLLYSFSLSFNKKCLLLLLLDPCELTCAPVLRHQRGSYQQFTPDSPSPLFHRCRYSVDDQLCLKVRVTFRSELQHPQRAVLGLHNVAPEIPRVSVLFVWSSQAVVQVVSAPNDFGGPSCGLMPCEELLSRYYFVALNLRVWIGIRVTSILWNDTCPVGNLCLPIRGAAAREV